MPCFLTSDGCELFYTDAGQGRPVVLLHAWPLSSAMWDAQATLLTRQGKGAHQGDLVLDRLQASDSANDDAVRGLER